MAITRAQQVRQMLKKGSEPMEQAGVMNYMPSEMVTVPKIAKSSPDTPTAKLAYITPEEQDILVDLNLYGSLKGKPNRGPGGIPSLEGDFGTPGGFVGGGGGRQDNDVSGRRDTGTGNYQKSDDKDDKEALKEYEKNRRAREKDPFYGTSLEGRQDLIEKENKRIEQLKKDARKSRREMSNLKKADDKKRRDRINKILSGGFGKNNPYGLSPTELRNLEVLGYGVEDLYGGEEPNKFFDDILTNALEKDDRLSGVNLETFQNRQLKDVVGSLPGPLLNILANSGLLQPGMTRNRKFFSADDYKSIFKNPKKSVLEAGKYTFDGKPITQAQFEMLSPSEMEMVYKDYDTRRKSGEIDAYGNEIIQTGGPDQQETDPCKGPNPPAYCFIGGNAPTTPDPVFTPAFRFMNRGGMVEDAPMSGIMDLDTTRQMLFIGGIAKGISKGIKGITRAAKKVVKSPFGKAAILGAIGFGIPRTSFTGLLGGKGASFSLGDILKKGLLKDSTSAFSLENLSGGKIAALSGLAGLIASKQTEEDDFDIDKYYEEEGLRNYLASLGPRYRLGTFNAAKGGKAEPVAKKVMPLLDMDGKEMDLREDGGFVPIGRMEKADDVPARLSKNEFVFTADAVRNAGEGDVDKGAEVMYNMMKNLEAGGEVSEESQGLDGAREMFQTAQRLEGVM